MYSVSATISGGGGGGGGSTSSTVSSFPYATGLQTISTALDNNSVVHTFGHSISGLAPAAYRYQLASTTTPNSGTVFFGPGGSGRFHLLTDPYVVNVMEWGARGDAVTNDTAAINRAISHASGISTSYRRPLLYFPPGRRYLISRLEVPRLIDIDMTGSTLFSASTEYDKPILQIGSSGQGSFFSNFGGSFKGLHVEYNGAFSTHGYPEEGRYDYFGVRIINALDSYIEVAEIQGFYGGLQLFSSGVTIDSPCAHNTVMIGSIYSCKVGIDFRAWGTGYSNENLIFNGNFAPSTAITNYGSAYGVRFSHAPGGYGGQNNNVFIKPCFQLGSWKLDWSAGLNVSGNFRVYNNGNEYLALNTGIAGATPPTHTAGTASDGTITWRYMGPYRRSAVLHENAGSNNRFIGSRWESAIGSFAVVSGAPGPNVYEYEYYGDVNDGNAVRQIEDIEYATDINVPSAGSFMVQGRDIQRTQSYSIDNLHHRAIQSVSGWTVAGMGFVNVWSHAFSDFSQGEMKLCRDGLYINNYSSGISGVFAAAGDMPYCIVDVQQNKRFRIDRQSMDSLGRIISSPLTDSFTKMDLGNTGVPVLPILLGSDTSVNIISVYDVMWTSSDAAVTQSIVSHPSVPYVMVGFYGQKLQGFSITKLMDTFPYLRSNDISVFCRNTLFGDTRRSTYGTPLYGFFQKRGEIINNAAPSVGNPTYWVVTTPGILAPSFTGGKTMVKGELRSNAGNVYAVNSAGVCGGSAPIGTGSGISDGTLTWDYLTSGAVLVAGPLL